jgi:cytochrome c oxidase subunit 2
MIATIYLSAINKTQSIFDAASPQAEKINRLSYGFLIAAAGVFLLVVVLTVYITIKFRSKENTSEPRQVTGNRKLEIVMVAFPMILVIVFFFWSLNTMNAVNPDRGNHLPDIVITGHQWWWEAVYPGSAVVSANEIHLPTGRKLLLQLNSADVIHDWWVPSFGAKMDMIPGMDNYLWVTINKPGIYEGTCSEFCGQQHAWMRIMVVAQTPADYNKWLLSHTKNATMPDDSLAFKGEGIFMNSSCSSCHRVQGTMAAGMEGPNLTHFASRQTMLAGMMDNNPENVEKWLTDPQKIKPGAHMPRFIFSKDSVRAITAYLNQLK